MHEFRREFLRMAGLSVAGGTTTLARPLVAQASGTASGSRDAYFNVRNYGHNHWHNSLIWGGDLHDIGIFGPGLIWGKGLSRGDKAEWDCPAAPISARATSPSH